MQTTKQDCYKSKEFKDHLWSEVSTTCQGGQWCYSAAERRLFYILFGLTIFLGAIYFSGFTNELASIYKSSKQLEAMNNQKINSMLEKKETTLLKEDPAK